MPKANKNDILEVVEAPGFEGRYAELLEYTVGFETYDTEIVEFSPTKELNETLAVVGKNMESM